MEVILNIIINITSKNGTVSSDYHQNAGQQCNRGKPQTDNISEQNKRMNICQANFKHFLRSGSNCMFCLNISADIRNTLQLADNSVKEEKIEPEKMYKIL